MTEATIANRMQTFIFNWIRFNYWLMRWTGIESMILKRLFILIPDDPSILHQFNRQKCVIGLLGNAVYRCADHQLTCVRVGVVRVGGKSAPTAEEKKYRNDKWQMASDNKWQVKKN